MDSKKASGVWQIKDILCPVPSLRCWAAKTRWMFGCGRCEAESRSWVQTLFDEDVTRVHGSRRSQTHATSEGNVFINSSCLFLFFLVSLYFKFQIDKIKAKAGSLYWLWISFQTQTLYIALVNLMPPLFNQNMDKSTWLNFVSMETFTAPPHAGLGVHMSRLHESDITIGGSTSLFLLFTPLTGRLRRTHCLSLTAVCSPAPFSASLCLPFLRASGTSTAHASIRQNRTAGADGAPQEAESDGHLSRWMTLKTSLTLKTCCDMNNSESFCCLFFQDEFLCFLGQKLFEILNSTVRNTDTDVCYLGCHLKYGSWLFIFKWML